MLKPLRGCGNAMRAALTALALATAILLAPVAVLAETERAVVALPNRATLSKFGNFVQHSQYGEVWMPTVTPLGWHPYPPCQWVRSKQYGWYFDDKTDWGQFIHHYGRWTHDQQLGWVWIAGNDFSPGWVVWRTSKDYVGWAPMVPEQDVETVTIETFNSNDQWLFMNIDRFNATCEVKDLIPLAEVPVVLEKTSYVTQFQSVNGLVIFILPSYITGEFVDINISFDPWPIELFTQVIADWNFVWHHTLITETVKVCTPANPAGK